MRNSYNSVKSFHYSYSDSALSRFRSLKHPPKPTEVLKSCGIGLHLALLLIGRHHSMSAFFFHVSEEVTMKTKLHVVAVCTAALLGSSAMADDEKSTADLSSWDSDSNKMVTQKEWSEAIDEQDLFDRIDKNNNGIFDADEAVADTALSYEANMDLDAGGHIERQEFVVGLFKKHDANDDDMLDETEFKEFSSKSEKTPLFMTNR
jgi:hypothetical protein